MWLYALVFVSDAAITWLAAREQLALTERAWSAVWWDGLLALAIGINMVGFVSASWEMLGPSITGSMLGMAAVIWRERRNARSL